MKYELAFREPKYVTNKSLSHIYLQKVNMKEEGDSFLKKMLDHVRKKGGPYRMREHLANPNRRVSFPTKDRDTEKDTTTLTPDRDIIRRPTPLKNMKMRQTSKNTPNPINNGSPKRNSVLHGHFGDLLHKNKTALVELGKDELSRPGIQLGDQGSDDNSATIITDLPQPLRSPATKPAISTNTSNDGPSLLRLGSSSGTKPSISANTSNGEPSLLRLRSSSDGTGTNISRTTTTPKPPPLFTNNPLDQPTSEGEQDEIRYFSWP